jgi:hypothetical protein
LAAITPTPPASATAEARLEREIPTPIPPWTIGSLTVQFPIFISGILSNKIFEKSNLGSSMFPKSRLSDFNFAIKLKSIKSISFFHLIDMLGEG